MKYIAVPCYSQVQKQHFFKEAHTMMKQISRKTISLMLVVAMLLVAVPSAMVVSADTTAKTTVHMPSVLNNATNGIDTFKNMDLMSDYAGRKEQYTVAKSDASQDPDGSEMIFLSATAYSDILTGMTGESYRDFYGTAGPWFAWNVYGGSTITFLGRLSKNALYQNLDNCMNNENTFKFQYWVNGSTQGWMTVTSGVTLQRISSQTDINNLKDTIPGIDNEFRGTAGTTRRNNDFNNYAFVLSTFTLPAEACAVRVVFPCIDKMLSNNGNGYFSTGLMMRATGGQEAAPTAFEVDTALGADLNNAAVADYLGVGAVSGAITRNETAPAAGEAAKTSAYVTYEVKGGSPFVVKGQLTPYARRFNLKFELSWSSDNQNFQPLYPRYSYAYNAGSNKYILTAALADIPYNARYIRVKNPVDYNNLGMTLPGNTTKTYDYTLWDTLGIIGVYFDSVDHANKPQMQGATISTDGQAKLRFMTEQGIGLPEGAKVVSYGTVMMPNQYMDPAKKAYKHDAALTVGNPYVATARETSDTLPETWVARLSNSEAYLGVKIAARSFVEYTLDGGATTQIIYGNTHVRAVYQISYAMATAIVGKKTEIEDGGVAINWTVAVPNTTEEAAVASLAAADVHTFILGNVAAVSYYVEHFQSQS